MKSRFRRLSRLAAPRRTKSLRTTSRRPRRPRFESLENRRVLAAAIDLASIDGRVFDDVSGNGFDAGEEISGASLTLVRDDGDGVFEPTGEDIEVDTATTDASGLYEFSRLTAGDYFAVQPQQIADGRPLERSVSTLITISGEAVEGQLITLVDGFNTTEQLVRDETNDGVPVTSSVAAPEAIGNERDLLVNKTSVNGAVQLSVDNPLLPDLLTFDSLSTGNGERRVSWDGPDGDATTIDDDGLAAVDLTSGGEAAGLRLQIGADLAGANAIVRIYSDDGEETTASRFSSVTIPIPATGGSPSAAEFLPFSSFTATGGDGADFSNVGAIELAISGTANVNGTAELVGTIGENEFVQNFANFETADVSLTKTVDDPSPTVGQQVTFTVTASNAGPDAASNLTITDTLPAGLTLISQSPSLGSYDPVTGLWTIERLDSDAAAVLTIVATLDSADPATNTAELTAVDQFDPDSTPDNQAADEDDLAIVVIVPETVDLSLVKQVSDAMPTIGTPVTFTVTATNSGPDSATGVAVLDQLPAGLVYVSDSPSQGSYDAESGVWTVGSLEAGASATLSLTATLTQDGTLTNTAEIIAAEQTDLDSTPANNDAAEDDQASVTLAAPIADLSLTKTSSTDRPDIDDEFVFTISLDNAGPDPASGVLVRDLLPAGLTFVTATTSQGTYDETTGIWTVGDVAVGETPLLTLSTRVESAGRNTNTAEIIAADQSDPDSTPANNIAAEDDQASASVTPPAIDLSLSKQVDIARPTVGQTVTFTLTAANAGPDAASGVAVTDVLPSGVTLIDSSASAGSYDPVSGIWSVGSVAAGGSAILTLTTTFGSADAVTNTAEITAANEFDVDSMPGNDVASEDDQAVAVLSPASADLSLIKIVDQATPDVGEAVTFTLSVINDGPDAATNVVIADQLPAGLDYVSDTASDGSYDAVSGRWIIDVLSASASATLQIIANVLSSGTATNVAQITAVDQLDPDSTPNNDDAQEDDQSSATVQSRQIDLSLTKTISDARPNVGDEVSFTLTLRNDGPDDASGILVTETLPAGLTFISDVPGQGSYDASTQLWTVGSLAAGEQRTLELIARVDEIGTGTNVAQVTAADQVDLDSTPGNDELSEDDLASVVYATPAADLSLTKTASTPVPNVGENVTFTIELQNSGPDPATQIVVEDILPAGLSMVFTSPDAGTYDAATGTWSIESLAVNESVTLQLVTLVESIGATTNTARVLSVIQADPDSTPGNDNEQEDDQASVVVTPPVIDLSLTKSATPLRPAVGETVTFTLTATNAGPDDASGVIVTDTLPAGFSLTSSSPDATFDPATAFDPATGRWSIGLLPAGESVSLDLVGSLDGPGDYINTAQVVAADQFDADSTPANDDPEEDDQASVLISTASADLSLSKFVDDASPNLGSQVVFTVTVANAGPDAAQDVSARDLLPSGLTFVESNASAGSYDASSGIWSLAQLESAESATLSITATVDAFAEITNTAEIIASSQFDPDSTAGNADPDEDDFASASLTPELVDLALTKIIDDESPNVGDVVEYLLTVSNDGPSPATDVTVSDSLPAGVSFNGATASTGSYDADSGLWTVGSIAAGESQTLQIEVLVGSTPGVANVAEVLTADQPDADSTPGNDVAAEDDQASVAFVTQLADLSLAKAVDNATPDRDDELTFTLTLRNDGPDQATGVAVQDLLPPGLSFVDATASDGEYDATGGRWTLPTLAASSSATLQIRAGIADLTSTELVVLTNSAELIAADQFDPDSTPGNAASDEDDFAEVTVTPNVVDVSVDAMVDNPTPVEGDVIQITITAANAAEIPATGVQINSLLPSGLIFLSAQPQQGSYDAVTGLWDLGTLPADGSVQLVITAEVETRGLKVVPIEVTALDQFDRDSKPGNGIEAEDDQAELIIRAPRLLSMRLFLSR